MTRRDLRTNISLSYAECSLKGMRFFCTGLYLLKDINSEIRKRKLRWIGHAIRKEDGEISKAALLWNPQGSRKRGRPKNSWRRSVIKEVGRSWNELRFVAAYRQKWKELIDNLCS